MNEEILQQIAKSGIAAPSADNQHVFLLAFGDDSIRLYPTPEFAGNTERHRRVLGLLSLGAVAENMRLRARELGLDTQIRWFPDGGKLLAQFDFRPSAELASSDLASAIHERHTNRRMYGGPALLDDEKAQLNTAAEAESVQLTWLEGSARSKALRLIWIAESERFLRQQLHEEIFSSIRFDLSWNETSDRSLPPGALEIEPPMRPMFKALRHWKLMRALTWLGVHRLIGLRAGWLPAWQAPAIGVLTSSQSSEDGALAVGSAFERLWLRATKLKLALQPLAASAVLPLQADSPHGISSRARAELSSGWASITPHTPLMVFRLGRASPPTFRTNRPALSEFLLEPNRRENA